MGIASGSQHSQDVAKEIIQSVGGIASSDSSYDQRVEAVSKILDKKQKAYGQTVHEENLVSGADLNKTQWVDTDINAQFKHEGGTAEEKRKEERNKCTK